MSDFHQYSSGSELQVLLIEDNPGDADLVVEYAQESSKNRIRIHHVSTMKEGIGALEKQSFDAILLDLNLPDSSGTDTFVCVQSHACTIPVIVVTGTEDELLAEECMKLGAQDYLSKQWINSSLGRSIRNIVYRVASSHKLASARLSLSNLVEESPDGIIVLNDRKEVLYANSRAVEILGPQAKSHWVFPYPLDSVESELSIKNDHGVTSYVEIRTGSIVWEESLSTLVTIRDETRRTLAEESEFRYSTLMMQSADCMIIHGLTGDIIDVNPCACRTYGYTKDELLHLNMDDLEADDKGTGGYSQFYSQLELNCPVEFHTNQRKRTGEIFPVEVSLTLIESGGKVLVISLCRDISDRILLDEQRKEALKETAALLKASQVVISGESIEKKSRAIFKLCSDHIGAPLGNFSLLQEDGIISEVLFQKDESGYVSQKQLLIPLRGFREEALNAKHALFNNHSSHCTYEGLLPDEYRKLDNVLFSPVILDGEPIGLIGLANKSDGFTDRDCRISDAFAEILAVAFREHRIRETLESSEERYRLLFDSSKDALLIYSPFVARFTSVNSAAVKLFSFSAKEDFLELGPVDISPEYQPCGTLSAELANQIISKTIDEGTYSFQWTCLRRGSQPFIVSGLSNRIELKEGFVIQFSLRDVTEQLKAEEERAEIEEQMRQAQKLESIGQLAGGVAHDFNNMLSVILGYSEDIVRNLREEDPLYQSAMEIVQAGQRSADLTRQLLAFSRKQKLQSKILNLNTVIDGLRNMLQRLLGEHILLKINTDPELGLVKADPGQLEQIVLNLAVNGRDAMVDGGQLTLSTFSYEVVTDSDSRALDLAKGSYVCLEVSDNGSGMSEEVLKRVFEPFYTTKPKEKGTGLGLSTVYGIVKQSNGSILARSVLDEGTTFTMYLPLTKEVSDHVEEGNVTFESSPEQIKILVVEDEVSLRKLVTIMLEREGFTVYQAENGGAALLQVEEEGVCPDLLLTDVVMPGMNGKILAQRIQKSVPGIKILYMSGYSNEVFDNGNSELDSVDDLNFLPKPFSMQDLREKVLSIIDAVT